MNRNICRSGGALVVSGLLYLGILLNPDALFAYQFDSQGFRVHADRPIPVEIHDVLADSVERLKRSTLYTPGQRFDLFLCHSNWRFCLLTRNPNAGGVVNAGISSHIVIRDCDIKANVLHPPNGWMYDAASRPLSYFIAHEATHVLHRQLDPLMMLRCSTAIREGYADYIGKAGHYDYPALRSAYLKNGLENETKRGLYHRYHLFVAYLLDHKKLSILDVLAAQPDLETTLSELGTNAERQLD